MNPSLYTSIIPIGLDRIETNQPSGLQRSAEACRSGAGSPV
jgi:hypothetical protein